MPNSARIWESRCFAHHYSQLHSFEHLHARFEILLPTSGRCTAYLNREPFAVEPGEMLVIFPGILHSFDAAQPVSGLVLAFYPDMLPQQGDALAKMRPSSPHLTIGALDRDVSHCLQKLCACADGQPLTAPLTQAYLTLLIAHLTPSLILVATPPSASKELLFSAMTYISQNLDKPLTLKDTARALGVNSYYLSHVLSERVHMGFRAYLNASRIDRAKRYLRETAWPIEEVGYACGFTTLRTFDRVFQEHCGCAPREYRKIALSCS